MPRNSHIFGTVADLFDFHIEEGAVTRKDIEVAGRMGRMRVHRVVHGDAQLEWPELCLLLENLPAAVSRDLRSMLPAERDDDCDGPVTDNALLEQITRFNGGAQQRSIDRVVKALADRRLSGPERVELLNGLNELEQGVQRAKRILQKLRG